MSRKSVANEENENNEGTPERLGPGGRLRAAREKTGLSKEKIAHQLHLRLSVIEAIEQDDYDNFEDLVFIRGYLRAYANVINYQADEIIKAFNNINSISPVKASVSLEHKVKVTKQRIKGHYFRWFSYLVILGLILFFVLWWRNDETLHHPESDTLVDDALAVFSLNALEGEHE